MARNAIGGDLAHIVFNHKLHQLLEGRGLRVPAEFGLRLGRVAPEVHHVCRAVEVFGHGHYCLARRNVYALLVHAFAFPAELDACVVECERRKFTDGVLNTGSDHEVFGLVVLQNEPHAFHVVLGVAPVAEAVQVAEVKAVLLALGNACGCERNLAGHEGLATAFGFMVKEDARAAEHIVSLAVLLDNPKTIEFGHGIRAVRVERGILVLRNLFYLAVKFACACLVNAAGLFEVVGTHGLKNTEHTGGVHVGGKFWRIEGNLHVALCGKVVNFCRLDLAYNLHEAHRVTHVSIVQMKIRLTLEMRNAFAEVHRRAADNAVNLVALGQKEFGEIGAILARDASDKSNVTLCHIFSFLCLKGFLVPVEKFLYAFVNFDLVGPAEAMELTHVNELARRAIGLACVKEHFAFKANSLHDEFAEFADGQFLTRTHVDVAIADFTEFRNGAATARAVVTVYCAINACAIMHAGILFDADDVAEVHVQEHMNGRVGHVFAPEELAERLASTPEGHLVILDAVLGEDFQNFILGGISVDAFDRALVHINLDAIPIVIVDELCQVNFTHHGRHHMAVFKMEVVIGAVEVRRHHSEIVGAVLQVVAFAHLEARNFCNGVFLVGVLKFAREESVFFHGLRSILRVDASGT